MGLQIFLYHRLAGLRLSQHHTWSLERLNYETSELNICPEEAQSSQSGAQYSPEKAQIFPYEAKATSKIMECRHLAYGWRAGNLN